MWHSLGGSGFDNQADQTSFVMAVLRQCLLCLRVKTSCQNKEVPYFCAKQTQSEQKSKKKQGTSNSSTVSPPVSSGKPL